MKNKLYTADEAINVLERTSLTDIDSKIRKAKNAEERERWNMLYNFVLQQRQRKIINNKKFIR
ncbi:MAG: hypothetical protein PUG19_09120 [Lactobacillus amylovorus]|jgi:hypothetical protein|nr:hypothetical protein [Lactobacillus amylovorus]